MIISLYGPPGSGKTTLGRLLANSLNQPFLDLDQLIEDQVGITIPEIFAQQGEIGFRSFEREIIKDVVAHHDGILALGGGTLLDDMNRVLVEESGSVVCLNCPVEILIERLMQTYNQRPLLNPELQERLPALLRERESHYNSFPLQVFVYNKSPSEIIWEIQILLGRFFIHGMGGGYEVKVINGGINHLGDELLRKNLEGPIALVCDENVGHYYSQPVSQSLCESGFLIKTLTIPAGESNKNINTIQGIWTGLINSELERNSTVVALGGGVVGDLAGFAAATFMRGIAWVILPTSLLAIVDSSLGGKTGFDLTEGKNLIGAFFAPKLVLSDPLTLHTLPDIEFKNGLVEVIKAGLIGDLELLRMCELGFDATKANLDLIIKRAMAVKIKIIEADPYEQGYRAALNLGHTIGHAIEKVSNYTIRHGFAVAIGLVIESKIAELLRIAVPGITDELIGIFKKFDLPMQLPIGIKTNQIIDSLKFDKKKHQGMLHFSLLEQAGKVKVDVKISDSDIVAKAINQIYFEHQSILQEVP